jgi:DNA-binding NarL/FixJ family response regulator
VAIAIQLVSSHPLLIRAVEETLISTRDLSTSLVTPGALHAESLSIPHSPRLFLLDACSLQTNLGPLAARLRSHSPGSKFLALLPPGGDTLTEKIRLFHWGIDGFVELHEAWQEELSQAIWSILRGQPWVPPELLLAFVTHAKTLLDAQLMHGHFLTAREAQVLQLLLRRQTNKDISSALKISERTVKFHVSNILSKLQLEDRRGLTTDNLPLKALASRA